jgi:hypothetical protein
VGIFQEKEMTEATQTADAAGEARKRAAASNFLAIVRGRLPLIFVHAIRFDEVVSKMGNKDAAAKFGTSVGKVFDIRKGRNFSYVDQGFKPNADDVAQAKSWAEQVGAQNAKGLTASGDKDLMLKIVGEYEARGLGTGAQRPARTPGEKQPAAAAAGAGGEQTQAAGANTADALLS